MDACHNNKNRINMSKSIHTTYKNIRGLTKNEIIEQYNDPDSDLTQLAKKSSIKKSVKRRRKLTKNNEKSSLT